MLIAGGDVGDRGRDAVGELDDLNLIAAGPASGLEDGAGDLDEGGFSGFDYTFVAIEEIVGANGGEDLVEIFAKHLVAVHADHALGVAVEKDEPEVADARRRRRRRCRRG